MSLRSLIRSMLYRSAGRESIGKALVLMLAGLLAACSPSSEPPGLQRAYPVGYRELQFNDIARQRPLAVKLWYPAVETAQQRDVAYNLLVTGYVAPAAEYRAADRARALLLISHGDRGDNTNQAWLAEALAGQGYLVATVDHWLNTSQNHVEEETVSVWHRPADLSFVLTELLRNPDWGDRIDRNRIGAIGHSSGGYTVLALAGAIYRRELIHSYCQRSPQPPDCELVSAVDFAKVDYAHAADSYRDERIAAVFAMAPAVGPSLDIDSLRAITIPVHIVASLDDELLPHRFHAGHVQQHIPAASMTALPAAGHFVYLPECSRAGKLWLYFHRFDLCGGRRPDVDRARVHGEVAKAALEFFQRALPGGGES
jgi:predicted dienelactone hydrolase